MWMDRKGIPSSIIHCLKDIMHKQSVAECTLPIIKSTLMHDTTQWDTFSNNRNADMLNYAARDVVTRELQRSSKYCASFKNSDSLLMVVGRPRYFGRRGTAELKVDNIQVVDINGRQTSVQAPVQKVLNLWTFR